MSENILPTRMVLQQQRAKLAAAKRGHELMKKKSDALSVKFREILSKIIDAKTELVRLVTEALFSTSKVRFALGDNFKYTVLESVNSNTPTRVKMRMENLAGVFLPTFEMESTGRGAQEYAGLAKGGQHVRECQELHAKVLAQVVKLASLQTAFSALDEVIKVTNRRVNALEYVVIPRVEGIIHYIDGEMSEAEREEFFRLKMMQKTKQRKADEEEAQERMERRAEQALIENGVLPPNASSSSSSSSSMLDEDDDDVVV